MNIGPFSPSQFKNEQNLPKKVYYIPISLASHFGENFMKFGPNIAKLQMFTFTSLCSVFVLYEIKMENKKSVVVFCQIGNFLSRIGKKHTFWHWEWGRISPTTMPRASIFGLKHHLVNLYQVCSNYISGAKNGPTPGVT